MEEKRVRKKHGEVELRSYMRMLDEGESINHVSRKYGINDKRLKVLWEKYLEKGAAALEKKKNIRAGYALKKKIVEDIEENHITLCSASLKYGASVSRIGVWLKSYRRGGVAALEKSRKQGRPPKMGRPKKNSRPLSELERLQKENQELKTEIALLKKVRALVEERNARLREIGHGPSKN